MFVFTIAIKNVHVLRKKEQNFYHNIQSVNHPLSLHVSAIVSFEVVFIVSVLISESDLEIISNVSLCVNFLQLRGNEIMTV